MPQETLSFKPGEVSVSVGFPCGPEVPTPTMLSLMRTSDLCAKSGIALGMDLVMGSSIVTVARNRVLDAFLKGKSNYLFWIDSDIVWEPADFLRLLMLSTQVDVVCAAYPAKNEERSLYINHDDLQHFELNKYSLIRIKGAGLGFCCIRRAIIEHLASIKDRVYDHLLGGFMADVFRLDIINDSQGRRALRGEDMAFFADLAELGYGIWLDPTVGLGHAGHYEYRNNPLNALGLTEAYKKLEVQ